MMLVICYSFRNIQLYNLLLLFPENNNSIGASSGGAGGAGGGSSVGKFDLGERGPTPPASLSHSYR